jgi:putative ABC transport system substrate-binding protein
MKGSVNSKYVPSINPVQVLSCREVSKIANSKAAAIVALVLAMVISAVALAAQPAKTPRIGFLFFGSKDQPHLEKFRQGMRELGYVEGKNILIEYRYAEGNADSVPGLAAELVALNPDVILTTTPGANGALLQATSAIPIVSVGGSLIRSGLVKSLAQPDRNLTGLTTDTGPGIYGKRVEILKEAFPKIRVVAMLGSAGTNFEDASAGGKAVGVQVHPLEIKNASEIDRAGDELKKLRANGLLIGTSVVAIQNLRKIAELAAKLRLPAMSQTPQYVEEGGLMAYGVNFGDLYRRAATYVDKILKGRKPADLPIEQPMKFELVINLKAATQIAMEVSPNVLARADRVIR